MCVRGYYKNLLHRRAGISELAYRSNINYSSLNNIPHFKHCKLNAKNQVICPCWALMEYFQLRKRVSASEPAFIFMDELPLTNQFFTHHLRTPLVFCNLDLKRYQSHSFRIGAASTAASNIQTMGRWHSTTIKKCVRIPALTVSRHNFLLEMTFHANRSCIIK